MNTQTKRKFRWFWAWNDDKEEAWLRQMAQQGWHLSKLGLPGHYTFEKGEPRDMVYRLDFKTTYKQDENEYLQIFQDAGWEFVGTMSSWHYFRIPMQGEEAPEIYTDVDSKILKYQRLMGFFTFFFPIFLIFVINRPGITKTPAFTFYDVIMIFFLLVELLFAYAMVCLFMRIQQLKKLR